MAENIVVTKDGRKYKTIITDIGNEKIAMAALEGKKVDVVTAVVTDGGGQYFIPTGDMTELVNEVWRGAIANKEVNAASPNMIDVKIFLDGTVGGFTARGIGLLDSEGDLIAVCNMPDTAKAVIVDGIAATLTLIMHIVVTNVDVLDFKIDPSVDTISSAELEAAIKKNTDEIMEQVGAMVAGASSKFKINITIPTEGWEDGPGSTGTAPGGITGEGSQNAGESDDADEPSGLRVNIPVDFIREDMVPVLTVLPAYENTAKDCGLNTTARTIDGALRVYAQNVPAAEMRASLAMICVSDGKSGGGASYVLPAATASRLGGVKIRPGSGLKVDDDGNISLDSATVKEVERLFDGSKG